MPRRPGRLQPDLAAVANRADRPAGRKPRHGSAPSASRTKPTASTAANRCRNAKSSPRMSSRSWAPSACAVDEPEQQRRIKLAHWIASPQHPLTARVMVNRLWHYIFGHGIVDTPSDFGNNGSAAHPSRTPRLARGRIRQERLVRETHPAAHPAVRRLPAVVRAPRRRPARPTPTAAFSGASRRAASRPRPSATACSPSPARSI